LTHCGRIRDSRRFSIRWGWGSWARPGQYSLNTLSLGVCYKVCEFSSGILPYQGAERSTDTRSQVMLVPERYTRMSAPRSSPTCPSTIAPRRGCPLVSPTPSRDDPFWALAPSGVVLGEVSNLGGAAE
jgi:hypothetical protein